MKTSRCTALTIFYDEPLELIAAHFSSLAGVVDHVIAVDGAFAHYPDAKGASDPTQHRMIQEICTGARLGLTLHVPTGPWYGNEVEKRNYTLALAEPVTREDGWYLSSDVDEVIVHVAEDWFEQLQRISDEGWGTMNIGIRETRVIPNDPGFVPNDTWNPITNMYRAVPGLAYGPAHFILHADGVCYRGTQDMEAVSPYDATHLLRFDHRQERPEYRNIAKRKYYAKRERLGLEKFTNWTLGGGNR